MSKVNSNVAKMAEQVALGKLTRRDFLKQSVLLGISATAASGLLTTYGGLSSGVAPAHAADEPAELRLWTITFDPFVKPIKRFAEEFTALHPNITIKVEDTADIFDKAPTVIEAGTGPDLYFFMARSLFEFFVAGKFLPLPESIMTKADWDAAFNEGARGIWQWDGKAYGFNADLNVEGFTILQINQSLLKQYGHEVPKEWIEAGAPPSWQDLMAFAKEVTVLKGDRVVTPGLVGAQTFWQYSRLFSLIYQLGGSYHDFENRKVHFNTPEGNEAMNLLYNWLKNEKVDSMDLGDAIDVFITQKNAFMAAAAPHWGTKTMLEQPDMEWTMLRIPPAFGDKNWFPVEGGWGYSVSATTQFPEQAWQFAAYCGNYENMRAIQLESAMLPTYIKAVEGGGDPEYLKDPYGRWNSVMLPILQYGKPVAWFIMNQSQFDDIVKTEMDKIYFDEKSIEQGLQDMEDSVNAMIEEKWRPYGGVPAQKK